MLNKSNNVIEGQKDRKNFKKQIPWNPFIVTKYNANSTLEKEPL